MNKREISARSGWGRWRDAALVMAVLTAAAGIAAAGGTQESATSHTIEVTGTGSAGGAPDVAIVRLGVENRSADLQAAIARTTAAMNQVNGALTADGVAAADIQTSIYSVNVEQPSQQPGTSGATVETYDVQDIATVTVRDLTALGKILPDALGAGANRIDDITFSVSDPTALQTGARAAAFKDAKNRAEQLASLAGVKLGPVVHVTESGGGPSPMPAVRFAAMSKAPPVSPGNVEVSVTLDVIFRIE